MRLMDVTPTAIETKRPRTKAVAKTTDSTASKPPRKTVSTSRKKPTVAQTPAVEAAHAAPADLHAMIETAAFYLAAERSFAPGHELEDWLEAERRIKALFTV
jgi:Protein of unknown function (DUF2934)